MLQGIFTTFLDKLPELHQLGQDLRQMRGHGEDVEQLNDPPPDKGLLSEQD